QLRGHEGEVRCLALAADGKTLASGAADKTIRLWDTATGPELRLLKGHEEWVEAVAFSSVGVLSSACGDGSIRLWEPATGKELYLLRGHDRGVKSIAFSPDGKTLASAGSDHTLRLWDVASGKVQRSFSASWITCVAFAPDG